MTTDPVNCPDPGTAPAPPDGRYYGKYRGVVLDNIDPDPLAPPGRILAEVPSIPGMLLNWAMPCVPFAGPEMGLWAIPPIGANVWIEFEGANANSPIWSGCFWSEPEEFPLPKTLSPEDPSLVSIFTMGFITIISNITPAEGGLTIEIIDPVVEVPITISCNSLGVEVQNGVSTAVLNPEEGITLTAGETVVAMTDAAMEVESSEINVTAENTSVESVVEVVGDVNITGAVEVEGDVEILGAVEVEGDVEILGAVEIEGDVAIAGAVEIAGDIAVAGAIEIAGDVAMVGAIELAGDLAMVGAIEVAGTILSPTFEGVLFGAVVPPLI